MFTWSESLLHIRKHTQIYEAMLSTMQDTQTQVRSLCQINHRCCLTRLFILMHMAWMTAALTAACWMMQSSCRCAPADQPYSSTQTPAPAPPQAQQRARPPCVHPPWTPPCQGRSLHFRLCHLQPAAYLLPLEHHRAQQGQLLAPSCPAHGSLQARQQQEQGQQQHRSRRGAW